jgi:predicted small secreted protein
MKNTLRHLMIAVAVLVALGSLSACRNTLEGAGQDVENMGENMQDAAHN